MDAEEVDLGLLNGLVIDLRFGGSRRDESKKIVLASGLHTNMPVLVISWDAESPLKELNRIVESENCLLIFDVVVGQESIDLLLIFLILHVQNHPLKASRKSHGLLLHFIENPLNIGSILLGVGSHELLDRLGIPKAVFLGKLHLADKIFPLLVRQIPVLQLFLSLDQKSHSLSLKQLFRGVLLFLDIAPGWLCGSCLHCWVTCWLSFHIYVI